VSLLDEIVEAALLLPVYVKYNNAVEAVLRHVSALGKDQLAVDDERAKEAVHELLRERLDQLLTEGKS
jgi:hypothetical protein